MKIPAVILCGLSLLIAVPAVGRAGDCTEHELDTVRIKEQLRHWRGLAAFRGWRLAEVDLDACVGPRGVQARLIVVPPANWSNLSQSYPVPLIVWLDGASGAALPVELRTFKQVAANVRNIIARAERNEDIRRLSERFSPLQVAMQPVDGPDSTSQFTIRYSAPVTGSGSDGEVFVVFDPRTPDGVVAYRLPRMDSLPARRELLRFVEVVSLHHPSCFPVDIEARRRPEVRDAANGGWKVTSGLAGSGCPQGFSASLDTGGVVAEVEPSNDETSAKGDALGP